MSNHQLMKKATLTASFVGIVGLSSLFSVKASHAATFDVNIPLKSYTLEGDTSFSAPNDELFDNFFKGDFILFEGVGTAISVNSPFIEPKKLKSVFAHFDYAFIGSDLEGFQFSLWSVTNQATAFSQFLSASTGESVSIDLTEFYTTQGFYQFAYDFSEEGAKAGFNNLVLKIETVPEPTTTLGLLALGIGAVTLKRKAKISFGVLLNSAS